MTAKRCYSLWVGLVAMCLCFIGSAAIATEPLPSHKVGAFQVSVLVDDESTGNTKILRDVAPELLTEVFPTSSFPMSVNSLLLQKGDQTILIDAGYGKRLLPHLKGKNIAPEDVSIIFITHMHYDHIDGLLSGENAVFPKATLYISQKEHDFWSDNANLKNYSEEKQAIMGKIFKKAQTVLSAYNGRIQLFNPGTIEKHDQTLIPGVAPIATYGHTPGHVSYMLADGEDKLLVIGDVVHVGRIQFPHPEATVVYDFDQAEAAKTRKALFSFMSANKLAFTGMHLTAPAYFGILVNDPAVPAGYAYTPFEK